MPAAEVLKSVEPAGFSFLAVQAEHAVRVYDLGNHHLDPFDRLLIAQAQLDSMTLLTDDETLRPTRTGCSASHPIHYLAANLKVIGKMLSTTLTCLSLTSVPRGG